MTPRRRLTSRDVARLAGVSQATVSRVLQGSTAVQAATRDLVLRAIQESGYTPNAAARWMRTRRTNIIALVVANLAVNPLYPAMLHLLSLALRKRGLWASVYQEDDFSDSTMRVMVEGGVDGVITTTAVDSAIPFLKQISNHVPLVLLHRSVASPEFDQFSADDNASATALAAYLIAHGRQRVGIISGHHLPSTLLQREIGFRAEFKRANLEIPDESILRVPSFSYEEGALAARALLASRQVDAIFGVNDVVAIGALDATRAQGFAVPQDIWVVGHDDVPMAAWYSINLTTVAQSRESMVEAAVARLCERLENPDLEPVQVILPYQIIHRGSSSSPTAGARSISNHRP